MKGFTLIEMLVSITIFSIVMTMALGSLLALSVADRKAETLKSGVDNLTFALDSMSRAIRTGSNFNCGNPAQPFLPNDCKTGANFFTFRASNGQQVYYQFDTTNNAIDRSSDGTNWAPITSPDIAVQNIGHLFTAVGTYLSSADKVQPFVVITVDAVLPVSATASTTIYMQTAVAQRIYDQ